MTAGDDDAARDALEALNVVAAKQPDLLLAGQGLEVVGRAMIELAANSDLEVSRLLTYGTSSILLVYGLCSERWGGYPVATCLGRLTVGHASHAEQCTASTPLTFPSMEALPSIIWALITLLRYLA